MLSRAAAWMSLPRSQVDSAADEREVLAEAAFSLAKRKIGALLVLPGKEPLARHLSGGVALQGQISHPLLDSIFDPSSDGHDGAVIVVGEYVERFGAHLPISTNLKEIRGYGTRHSAALGLSECSDATIIAVSEERGTVSVAQRGTLTTVDSSAALLKMLENTPAVNASTETANGWGRHFATHWRLQVLALSLAMIAWFLLAYDPSTVVRTFDVPIEYRNLRSGLVPEGPIAEAQVTLSGSESSFRFVTPESLKITIDLGGLGTGGHVVQVDEDNIQLPANVAIDNIEPDVLGLYLREQSPRPSGGPQ